MKQLIISICVILIHIHLNAQATYEYIKTNELRPRTGTQVRVTSPLRMPDGSVLSTALLDTNKIAKQIKDSLLANSFIRPELIIRMANDTTLYEMTTPSNPYSLNIAYTIFRPYGCKEISSIKVNNVSQTVPTIAEGQVVTGTLPISLEGPSTVANFYYKRFTVAIAAGRDTVKQSLILEQGWRIYAGGMDFIEGLTVYPNFAGWASEITLDGSCSFAIVDTDGGRVCIYMPQDYLSNEIYINGLPTSVMFFQATLSAYNISNSRGAVRRYDLLYTKNMYTNPIQNLEIR